MKTLTTGSDFFLEELIAGLVIWGGIFFTSTIQSFT